MRIGVLGGTFNPIHNAHVQMITCAKEKLHLDEALLMVTADPPHKAVDGRIPADIRVHMTDLAVKDLPGVHSSDLELKRSGKSYTLYTLLELQQLYPGAELFLILGSDMLQDLVNWHEPKEVVKNCTLACVPRKGRNAADEVAAATLRRDFAAKLVMLPDYAEEMSSTDIRNRVEFALPVSDKLHPDVEWFIYETGLYFPAAFQQLQSRLRADISQRRYRHVVGTMIQAVELAARWGADGQSARLAALLHDCAKGLDETQLSVLAGDDSGIRAVQHAFAGAVLARTRYGVTDESILRAIRLHCTGDYAMTALDKVIYLADATERSRDYPGVDVFRKSLKKGPDAAMMFALAQTEKRLRETGEPLHPATARALQYYKSLKEEKT